MTVRCVAVTGATGTIGAPLVAELRAAGIAVRALSRRPLAHAPGIEWIVGDMLDPGALRELVAGADVVVHAAGQLHGDPAIVMRTMVDGTRAILDAARNIRIVHLSSLVVVDTATPRDLIDASAPLEPTPDRRGVYTRAKCAAEALARDASKDQDVVIVRPGLVVGPATTVMPASVALRVGGAWMPTGPAEALLPVIDVSELARALRWTALDGQPGAMLHFVNRDPPARRTLFRQLQQAAGGGVLLPGGSTLLRCSALAQRVSGAAYRLLSTARPHRWGSDLPQP